MKRAKLHKRSDRVRELLPHRASGRLRDAQGWMDDADNLYLSFRTDHGVFVVIMSEFMGVEVAINGILQHCDERLYEAAKDARDEIVGTGLGD